MLEVQTAAPGIAVWNPSFDVTPAELITGVITEVLNFPLLLASLFFYFFFFEIWAQYSFKTTEMVVVKRRA